MSLAGKTALVTGSARGIGLAIARRLLSDGAEKCILWDRDKEALQSASDQLSPLGKVETNTLDLVSTDQVKKTSDKLRDAGDRVSILVNNAGIAGVSKKLWECSPQEWREVIEIDLLGVFHCCHAFVAGMIGGGWGRIVNVASIAGKEGNPNASHYSAAKAGVIGLTKSLAKELADTEICVNCITPAVIETEILEQCSKEHVEYMLSRIPMGRPGKPEEVAALVSWLCSEECSFSTGAVFDISGGRATY